MKESETRERLEEYAPPGVLAPVFQKLDSAIYLFNYWDLVISGDLIPPVCPSEIKKRFSAKYYFTRVQLRNTQLVPMTLIEECADFESRRC